MANRKSIKGEPTQITQKNQRLILPVTILLNPRVLYANLLNNHTNLSSCAVSTSSSGSSKSISRDPSSANLFLNVKNGTNGGTSPNGSPGNSTSSITSTDKEYFINMYGNSLNSAECTTPTTTTTTTTASIITNSTLFDSSESGQSDSSDSFSSSAGLHDHANVLPNQPPHATSVPNMSPNNCQPNSGQSVSLNNTGSVPAVPYYHQNFYYQDQPVPKTNSDEIIENLKHKFLDFCEDQAKMANEFEIKLMFLEHFFDPINEKVPSKVFKSTEAVFSRLDLFCKVLIALKMPYESIEIEKLKSESVDKAWFYLKYLPNQLENTPLFRHVSLREFLQQQSVNCKDPKQVFLTKEDVVAQNSTNGNSSDASKNFGLIDEIKLICNMFLLELGDWFSIFEFKQNKKVRKWFENGLIDGTLPKYVIEIYRKKKDKNEKANKDFKYNVEDLNIKHVIDSDWSFSNWMCREHGGDWYLTYSKLPHVMNWNSDEDHSKDSLELRNSKIIGYYDHPINDIVKSTHFDSHLEYCFHNVQWHYYTPINAASSIQKYPAVIMTSKFDFGPLFSLRGVQFVFSSKSHFLGETLIENAFLFKSSDFVKNEEIKDLIKCPFVGSRIYNMVDKYRTRYVEARTCNLGGFLNKKFIFTNPISSKKLCMDNYNGILKALKEAKEKGNPMPSTSNNYLAKILYDYCKYYCGVDLEKKSL